VAEQVADTAAEEVPEAAQVVAREAVRAELEAARAVVPEAAGLVSAVRTAILLTIKHARLFRRSLRPHPPINK
jgi:hypothetical protein